MIVVFAYESFVLTFPEAFWAKQAIVLVLPVELLALLWYIGMETPFPRCVKLIFMEFLCFWSAIGGVIIAEQLLVSGIACAGITTGTGRHWHRSPAPFIRSCRGATARPSSPHSL